MSDYVDSQSEKCREHGCSVMIPKLFKSYCGEAVRES